MRFSSLVASAGLLASMAVLTHDAHAAFPAGGNVTGLTLSKGAVMEGEDVTFTITGTGKCAVQVFGLPNPPLGGMRTSGQLPLTVHATANTGGTFNIFVDVLRDTSDPMWCTGAGTSKLTVNVPIRAGFGALAIPLPPMITGVERVPAGPGSAPRPEATIHYTGEDFQVRVMGSVPDQGNVSPNKCGYKVGLQSIETSKLSNETDFDSFGVKDLGWPPGPGDYRVLVTPKQFTGATFSACGGKAELGDVKFFPKAAWVTGLKLVGLAYHFRMGDAMGMPQFCEACGSVFSPAHDRAFLGIQPNVVGATPGTQGTCAYEITQTGNGAPGAIEGSHKNGQALSSLQFPTSLSAPWWNMYDNDNNAVTVTISPGKDALWPSCNILGGRITKTIKWTKNTNLKPVVIE